MKSENSVVLQALLIMAYGLLYLSHRSSLPPTKETSLVDVPVDEVAEAATMSAPYCPHRIAAYVRARDRGVAGFAFLWFPPTRPTRRGLPLQETGPREPPRVTRECCHDSNRYLPTAPRRRTESVPFSAPTRDVP